MAQEGDYTKLNFVDQICKVMKLQGLQGKYKANEINYEDKDDYVELKLGFSIEKIDSITLVGKASGCINPKLAGFAPFRPTPLYCYLAFCLGQSLNSVCPWVVGDPA